MAAARIVEAQEQASKYLGATTSTGIPVVQLGAAGAFSNTIPFARGEYIYEIYYETPAPGAVLYYVVGCKKIQIICMTTTRNIRPTIKRFHLDIMHQVGWRQYQLPYLWLEVQ